MALKRVQRVRHPTSESDAFVGRSGELTIDETTSVVKVHDGVTPGGHPTAKADASNLRAASSSQDGKALASHILLLERLRIQHASSVEPSPAFAHMRWFDSQNNILKERNAANDAWVNVAQKVGNGWVPYMNGALLGDVAPLNLTDLDVRYVNVTGDVMTGDLKVAKNTSASYVSRVNDGLADTKVWALRNNGSELVVNLVNDAENTLVPITTFAREAMATSAIGFHADSVVVGLTTEVDLIADQLLTAAGGWKKLPGGLILEWGNATVDGNAGTGADPLATITFPVAFTALYQVVIGAYSGSSSATDSENLPSLVTQSNTQFQMRNANNSTVRVNWMAIGTKV